MFSMNQEGRHLEVHRFSFDQREREGQQQILGAPLVSFYMLKDVGHDTMDDDASARI